MRLISVRRMAGFAALFAAIVAACDDAPVAPGSDAPTDPDVTESADIPGLLVSSARGLVSTRPQAFVSLAPGSATQGTRVRVRNTTGGGSVEAVLSDGGFDPVAIPATSEDIIAIDILEDAASVLAVSRVPVIFPPIVIRTDPPQRRTSVPLNALLVIVFSEPIDPESVGGGAITLRSTYGDVAVDFSMRDEGTVVEVRPRAPLRPLTDYVLEIGTGIRDLTGDNLTTVESIAFQTAPCLPLDSTPFSVRILPDTLTLPVGSYSGFIVAVDSGARIINEFPDTSLTWATTDPSIVSMDWVGSVGGEAIGEAYVTVEYQGEIDSALVIVTESPPPGPFGIFPGGATIPIGFELQLEIMHPAGTEPPQVSWTTRDASIAAVGETGLVTAVAAGSTFVIATGGGETDSAEIEVYDPTPPLADLYVIWPDSFLLQVGDVRQIGVSGPDWPPPPVEWTFSAAGVVAVDTQGQLTALAPGTTDIIATFSDGSSTTAFAEVVPAGSLGYITLVPTEVAAVVGDTVRFTIEFDATAAALFGAENPAWGTSSPNVQVLRYLASGVFEAINAGAARVRAYVGPLIADATVTVTP